MAGMDPSKVLFNLENAHIVLLEGDSMAMTILSQIMLGFNARNVHRLETLDEAKVYLEEHNADLIVYDPTTLPGGYEFVPWLRRHAPKHAKYASVLAITSHTQASRVSELRDSGANFIVTKPLTPAIIFERIMWMARENRPYVECKAYAGPDRRFKDVGAPIGTMGRRAEDIELATKYAPEHEMNQTDIDDIMSPGRRSQ
jgi:DNA-binding response OmpR family regulator